MQTQPEMVQALQFVDLDLRCCLEFILVTKMIIPLLFEKREENTT